MAPHSPGGNAGVRAGDRLERIEGVAIDQALDVPQVLARLGSWSKAKYQLSRGGVEFPPTCWWAKRPSTAPECTSTWWDLRT